MLFDQNMLIFVHIWTARLDTLLSGKDEFKRTKLNTTNYFLNVFVLTCFFKLQKTIFILCMLKFKLIAGLCFWKWMAILGVDFTWSTFTNCIIFTWASGRAWTHHGFPSRMCRWWRNVSVNLRWESVVTRLSTVGVSWTSRIERRSSAMMRSRQMTTAGLCENLRCAPPASDSGSLTVRR